MQMYNITWGTSTILAEIFYVCIGLVFILVGLKALKDETAKTKVPTAIFWFILAATFMVGPYLPTFVTGLAVIALAVLTGAKLVNQTKNDEATHEEIRANADRFGFKVFIPPVVLAASAVIVATVFSSLGSNNAIGISALIALIVSVILFKSDMKTPINEGVRLMDNVNAVGMLPQVLAALGALFTAAGVGAVIASGVSVIIPEGNKFIATAVYCIAMALFTMIMGNGFAAFSVITVGVGIPFLIMQGANPVVVGALGLTAGYCGTLMTPMAANFNIMPAALLETKSKYRIIFCQLPYALVMLVIHILLMYFLAF